MSDLPRKSAEPMALRAGIPPRSLQAFLGLREWDEDRLVDRLQWIVSRDHANPWAIGIIDETGSPRDGHHTACAQRQWCGSLGKIENCVVSVHAGYTLGDFHCVLDSDLFVPKSWVDDRTMRAEVGMPDDVNLRMKLQYAAPGLTPRAVLEKLSTIRMVDVCIPTTDGRLLVMPRYIEPEAERQLVLEKLRLALPPQPPPRIRSGGVVLPAAPRPCSADL